MRLVYEHYMCCTESGKEVVINVPMPDGAVMVPTLMCAKAWKELRLKTRGLHE